MSRALAEKLRELRTSTQQDLERGKRLEYEALVGAVVRAARRHRLCEGSAPLRLLDGTRTA